jgi:hypothetical protein
VQANNFNFAPEKNTAPIFTPSAAVFGNITKQMEFNMTQASFTPTFVPKFNE